MNPKASYRTLIWIIVILVATNLSTIGSFYYHRMREMRPLEAQPIDRQVVPGEQRTRFFRDQLNLDDQQLVQFREINRNFNREARSIEQNLAQLREDLINELGSSMPDSSRLNAMAAQIGNHHRELKEVTTTFYLDMKRICTTEQQAKLHLIFQSMLNTDNQVNLPQPGNQGGRWGNRK